MKTSKLRGFTLIEIMIAAGIIALLAAIAVPSFLRARNRAQASMVLNNLRLLDAAKDQYAAESGLAPTVMPTGAQIASYLKSESSLASAAATTTNGTVPDPKLTFVSYALNDLGTLPSVSGTGSLGTTVDFAFWSPFTAAD